VVHVIWGPACLYSQGVAGEKGKFVTLGEKNFIETKKLFILIKIYRDLS